MTESPEEIFPLKPRLLDGNKPPLVHVLFKKAGDPFFGGARLRGFQLLHRIFSSFKDHEIILLPRAKDPEFCGPRATE